ncbi:vWA domain-containing protein, partial [Thalassolituus sp. UBA6592]|uniref:vWA domain-containing protein n=2 Tax=unclassified Thalassolituus TaxID=2624967 RepID=UPI0025FCA07B
MQIQRWLSGVIFLSLLPFFFSSSAFAAPTQKPADVRIIVDISGSMKKTDPQNLRVPAVNLLVELLPADAQSGVWTFGQYVNMLVPLGTADNDWRAAAKKEAASINSVGLYTNLTGALEKAAWQIEENSPYQQSIILLTDGKIDMPPVAGQSVNAQERTRLFADILPAYRNAGAKIHTLALSDTADKELLQQIALETDGMYLQATDADQLLKAFLKAFDRAVPVEQVPMDDNLFEIDDSVSEFTALIFRKAGGKETRLISPSGKIISAATALTDDSVRWHQDVNFDLITISDPEAGGWKADADIDPDNRVQILSDLSLGVEGLPNSIFSGNPIELQIALNNAGEVVNEAAILGLTDVTLKVTAPDGRSGSKLLSDPESLPADGVFRETMSRLSQPGEYRFEITAVGRTFQRRQELTATLMEPLKVEVADDYGQQVTRIRVLPESDNIDTGLSRVLAKVSSPDGSSLIHTLDFDSEEKAWHMELSAEKGPGQYDVILNIRGVSVGGATFRSKPDDIVREFPLINPDVAATDTAAMDAVSEAAAATPEESAEETPETEPVAEEAAEPEPAEAPEPEPVPEPEPEPEP